VSNSVCTQLSGKLRILGSELLFIDCQWLLQRLIAQDVSFEIRAADPSRFAHNLGTSNMRLHRNLSCFAPLFRTRLPSSLGQYLHTNLRSNNRFRIKIENKFHLQATLK
jgi:hypothetical protein